MKPRIPAEILKLLRGSAMIFVCRILGAAAVFVTQVVLARWIGAEELGHYVYAFSWSLMIGTIATLGFPASSFRTIGHGIALGDEGYIRGFVRRGTQIIVGTSVLACAIGLAVVYSTSQSGSSSHMAVFMLAMLIVPIFALLRWQSSIAYGHSWFGLAIIPENLVRPLMLLLAIILVWNTRGQLDATVVMLLNMIMTMTVTFALGLAVSRSRTARNPAPAQPVYATTDWFNTAIPLLFVILFTNYFMELNLVIAGRHLGAEQLAVFNAAFRTAFLISFGIQAVDAYILPRAAQLHAVKDTASLQKLISRASRLKLVGALLAIVCLVFAGNQILGLFGPGFVAAYPSLIIIACAQLLVAALGPLTYLLAIYGHQYHCLYVFAASLLLMLGMHSYLSGAYGINGAAVTVATVMGLQSLWLYILVVKKLHLSPSAFSGLLTRK